MFIDRRYEELGSMRAELAELQAGVQIREALVALSRLREWQALTAATARAKEALTARMCSRNATDDQRREFAAEVRIMDTYIKAPSRAAIEMTAMISRASELEKNITKLETVLPRKGGRDG